MSKRANVLLVVLLMVSSLIVVKAASASDSIPKPSVPEFTVELVDNSYDVPLTTTTDPYTGKTVTQGGYHVKGEPEIEIRIKNQPYDTSTNKTIGLFYQVRTKGHFSPNWDIVEYWIKGGYNPRSPYREQDYGSQYTVLRFGDTGHDIPSEGQMDFQVQALLGYVVIHGDPNHSIDLYNLFASFSFTGETSDWSTTQTMTFSSSGWSSTSSSSPTETPDQTNEPVPSQTNETSPQETSPSPASTPDQATEPTTYETSQTLQIAAIIGTVIAVVLVSAILLVYFRKRKLSGEHS
jgi:hypothetical protein